MNTPFAKLGRAIAGKKARWVTLIFWVLLVAVLSFIWPNVNAQETDGHSQLLPKDAMSSQAQKLIKEQFPDSKGKPLLIVWSRENGLTEKDLQAIQSFYQSNGKQPLTDQEKSQTFAQLPLEAFKKMTSDDGKAVVTPIIFNENITTDQLKVNLDSIKNQIIKTSGSGVFEKKLSDSGLHVRLTGPAGIQTDTVALFSQADMTLLMATVLLVLILLIVLYRSPLLALLPLLSVGVAYALISPLLGWMAREGWVVIDQQSVSIMTVLLFGAGTDYCLFLISHYRDALYRESNHYTALKQAIKESGAAIAMSALTVVLGLVTLRLARYGSYQMFSVPFALAVLVMWMAAISLLPAFLALFGRAAFYPFIPRTAELNEQRAAKKGQR